MRSKKMSKKMYAIIISLVMTISVLPMALLANTLPGEPGPTRCFSEVYGYYHCLDSRTGHDRGDQFSFDDFIQSIATGNWTPEELAAFQSFLADAWAAFESDVVVKRIYANEHVFGEDSPLDDLFNSGLLFVDTAILSTEFRNIDGAMPQSSSCQAGKHHGVDISGAQAPQTMHRMWGNGGLCITETITIRFCSTCNTVGIERQQIAFWCWEC